MPKILTSAMRAHLDAETTRLAAIWRITRKDGAQFFFTDHDRDIVFGGEVYRADAGFERTAIRSDAGFAVDNLDLVGVFAEGGFRHRPPDQRPRGARDAGRRLHLRCGRERSPAEVQEARPFAQPGDPQRDLVPVNAEREAFIETRAQEVDLPVRFTVVYQDLERDADIGTQYAKRVAGPSSAMHSQNVATFDLPLMLTAAEAKGIASGSCTRLAGAHRLRVAPALDPCRPRARGRRAGGTRRRHALECPLLETELGANLELAWKTVLEESSSYTVTAVPSGGLNYLPQVDPVSSEARLFLLDVPLDPRRHA